MSLDRSHEGQETESRVRQACGGVQNAVQAGRQPLPACAGQCRAASRTHAAEATSSGMGLDQAESSQGHDLVIMALACDVRVARARFEPATSGLRVQRLAVEQSHPEREYVLPRVRQRQPSEAS